MIQNTFYDISKWKEQEHKKPSRGSRPNSVFLNPNNEKLYYFKQSNANYPSEIWCEIIAGKLGQLAGYNVLDYNVAIKDGVIGCLSESMINGDDIEILHGVEILEDFVETFEITDKPIYSFQDVKLICNQQVEREKEFLLKFIEIIFFDALIGNTDRHSENWAFSSRVYIEIPKLEHIENFWKRFAIQAVYGIALIALSNDNLLPKKNFRWLEFLPIYDSGSCLGREIQEEKIDNYLLNPNKITKYINKGKSEIQWESEKISLFDIAQKVYKSNKKIAQPLLTKLLSNISNSNIELLVNNIDNTLPKEYNQFALPLKRKQLIITLLQKRLERLKKLPL